MARQQDPKIGLQPDVAARIASYVPESLDPDSWARIAAKARDLVARSAPPTPKMAQDRLTTLCGLAASAPEHQRHDFDLLFSASVRARHEVTCGATPRSLQQYRGRLNLLADVHYDAYRPARKVATTVEQVPDADDSLTDVLEEPGVPECLVRFLVAGLGAGREGVEASRCQLQHEKAGTVVVRPTGRRRRVSGAVCCHAEVLPEGVLLSGEDRRAATEWLTDHGHAVPAPGAMSATWLRRVIAEGGPAVVTMTRNALSRSELDRATKLVPHGTEDCSDRVHLRG